MSDVNLPHTYTYDSTPTPFPSPTSFLLHASCSLHPSPLSHAGGALGSAQIPSNLRPSPLPLSHPPFPHSQVGLCERQGRCGAAAELQLDAARGEWPRQRHAGIAAAGVLEDLRARRGVQRHLRLGLQLHCAEGDRAASPSLFSLMSLFPCR